MKSNDDKPKTVSGHVIGEITMEAHIAGTEKPYDRMRRLVTAWKGEQKVANPKVNTTHEPEATVKE